MIRLDKQHLFKSATSTIKAYFRSQEWRQALIFLFFVLLAFGFWLLQSLQEDYEITLNIPVRYRNLPPEITYTHTPPDRITARVKDRGSVLLNYSFGRIFASIDVNMKNISGTNGSYIIPGREVQSEISKQLMSTTQLVSFEPGEIRVNYSQRSHKPAPVVFDGTIHTAQGFAISGEINISPATVEVYTNKERLDTLTQVNTVFTEIKNANKTVTRIIQLEELPGTVYEPNMITVTIPIEEFTEKTLDVPVTFTGVPYNYVIRAFPSTVRVNAYVPLSRYKDLEADEFAIELDYRELENSPSGSVFLQLTRQPEWINNVSIQPNQIEFIFEKIR